jgi:opacity protein-like surface antigen
VRPRTVVPVAVALLAAAPLTRAQDAPAPPTEPSRPRFTLALNGAFGMGSLEYDHSQTFREFAEEGRVDAAYADGSGPGFDIGLTFRFNRWLGVAAAFSSVNRDGEAAYQADFPHPLFLARPRHAEGTVGGLSHKESAGHFDLVLHHRRGSLDLAFFAGPSLFKVTSTVVVAPLRYTHAYPYDSVTVTVADTSPRHDDVFGFNLGAAVDVWFGKVGLGAQVRYARASADLALSGGDPFPLDVGGVQVAAGLRVGF